MMRGLGILTLYIPSGYYATSFGSVSTDDQGAELAPAIDQAKVASLER